MISCCTKIGLMLCRHLVELVSAVSATNLTITGLHTLGMA